MKRGYSSLVRAGGTLALVVGLACGVQAFTVTATATCSNGQNSGGCKSSATTTPAERPYGAYLDGFNLLVDTIDLILP